MVGRWYYCPARQQRIGMRLTLKDRIIQKLWLRYRRMEEPDVFMVTGFFPAVWVRK